ncbi:hypothetical protein AgCh_000381 [Apium graveolens]
MQHRHAFECVDRSLRDIMSDVDKRRAKKHFGGITIVFGGDFRQILPIIPKASRAEVVCATLNKSKLWDFCEVFLLKQNMRLNAGIQNRRIKSSLNSASGSLRSVMDSIDDAGDDDNDFRTAFPVEYLNSINMPCIPKHELKLKICYAMTINKSQGQSLDTVGLYLPRAAFSHDIFMLRFLEFAVKDPVGNLNPVQTNLCIRFTGSTTVRTAPDDSMIPLQKFKFLDLGDLFAEANKCLPQQQPEFVIGSVQIGTLPSTHFYINLDDESVTDMRQREEFDARIPLSRSMRKQIGGFIGVTNVCTRFRLMVLAEDETFACNVVLNDRAARRILGTSAAKDPSKSFPKVLKSLVGRPISVELSLTKSNVVEDNNLFYAKDIYEPIMQTPTPSDSPILFEGYSNNINTEYSEADDVHVTPGSAKSVNKKIKKTLKVRVTRMWRSINGLGEVLRHNLILLDCENTHLVAVVSPAIWNQFAGLLNPGTLYFIRNIGVMPATGIIRIGNLPSTNIFINIDYPDIVALRQRPVELDSIAAEMYMITTNTDMRGRVKEIITLLSDMYGNIAGNDVLLPANKLFPNTRSTKPFQLEDGPPFEIDLWNSLCTRVVQGNYKEEGDLWLEVKQYGVGKKVTSEYKACEYIQNAPEGDNRNGIGVVIRDAGGHLLRLTYGTIPGLTNLNSALWAILLGMHRAFQDSYEWVIIETDNIQAYRECKYYKEEGITTYFRQTFRLILSRLSDKNIRYELNLVHPNRNVVARHLVLLGRQESHDLQTFDRPVADIHNFLNMDLGIGPEQARFQDFEVNDPEPPIDGRFLDDAVARLGVEKRRSMLLTKKTKNRYSWKGFGIIPKTLQLLKAYAVSNPTKEQLVDVVQRHFMMMQLDELQVIPGVVHSAKRLKMLVDDFIFLGARVGAGKSTIQMLDRAYRVRDTMVQLSKIDNMMKEEANNLYEVIEILHLKHKEYAEDMQGSWFRIDDTEVESPFPPSDKIGINSVQREVEEIILDIYVSRDDLANI